MLRIACAAVLMGLLLVGASAAQPTRSVFKGRIKDVRGTYGSLTLTLGEGKQAQDRTFDIQGARIVGLAGGEWKVGDLREGDPVEVEMTANGKLVQEIRVLPERRIR